MDIYHLGKTMSTDKPQWSSSLWLYIRMGEGRLRAWQDAPAVFSYYVMSNGAKVLGSHTKTHLRVHKAKHSGFGAIYRVTAHTLLEFRKGSVDPTHVNIKPDALPWSIVTGDLEDCSVDLGLCMVNAAKSYKAYMEPQKVAIMLSGGSDSCGNLWAMLEAGFDVHAYTVTVDDDGFDAVEAAKMAKHFGVEHTILKFPKDPNKVFDLMKASVAVTGATDYANVTMGCLTEFALRHIKEKVVFHGHFGDSFWGNRGTLFGTFMRDYPDSQTEYHWNLWRYLTQSVGSTPQNAQIDSLHQNHGKEWRAIYAHPNVQRNIFGCSLEVTPIKKGKKHLRHLLNRYYPDGSWLREGKNQYGYPEGAGINKLKESCPFLRKENCGKLYPQIINMMTGAK